MSSAWREGLDEVVVGTQLQSGDPVLLLTPRRQEDHRHITRLPDPPAQVEPVDVGEHEVEDDEAGCVLADRLPGSGAVRGLTSEESLSVEVADDHVAYHRFVIDHQHALHCAHANGGLVPPGVGVSHTPTP